MEKLSDVLKVFLEKYFIPTIISVPAAIIIVALFPDLLSIKSNTSLSIYIAMVFCIVFLVVLVIESAVKIIKRHCDQKKEKQALDIQQEEKRNKQIRSLWAYVDKLTPDDKRALFMFIHTNNEPIESSAEYAGNSIFNDRNVMHVTIKEIRKEPFQSPTSAFLENHIFIAREPIEVPVKMYKLADGFFALLKSSYEQYNQISNFKEDNQYDNP